MAKPVDKKKVVKNIAFYGDAASGPETDEYKDAFEIARQLAQAGYTVVNGGGPGVMEAATKGAEEVGGDTLVVTFAPKSATHFEGRYLGNKADREIKTTNYIDRMFGLMENADLFLIFKGGTGTISEFGTAWVLAKLYYGHHKPFVLVGGFWRPIIHSISNNLNIDEKELNVFKIVDNRDDVKTAVEQLSEEIENHDHGHCKMCEEGAFMN